MPVAAPLLPSPRARGAFLQELMEHRGTPRNQLAALSGLTNTYIRDLEGDRIANVPRENLIALGVALNLPLPAVDDVLRRFDRSPLDEPDIPAFLATAERLSLSNALHACHNIAYELFSTACLVRGQRVTLVTDRPTSALRPPGYRAFFDRQLVNPHPLYTPLIEAVGHQRRVALWAATQQSGVEHLISIAGMEAYASGGDAQQRPWRRLHLQAQIELIEQRPRYRLLPTLSPLNFAYSIAVPRDGSRPMLGFEGQAAPGMVRHALGRLTGFATTSPSMLSCFEEDLEHVRSSVERSLASRDAVLGWLRGLVAAIPARAPRATRSRATAA